MIHWGSLKKQTTQMTTDAAADDLDCSQILNSWWIQFNPDSGSSKNQCKTPSWKSLSKILKSIEVAKRFKSNLELKSKIHNWDFKKMITICSQSNQIEVQKNHNLGFQKDEQCSTTFWSSWIPKSRVVMQSKKVNLLARNSFSLIGIYLSHYKGTIL